MVKYTRMRNRLVLVTGPDGLLGSNLIRRLLAEGYSVRAFVHPSSKAKTLRTLPIEFFTGDVMQPEALMWAMEGCHAVVHAAALTDVWPSKSMRVRRVNIEGTRHVVQAALHHNIHKLVYIGSASSAELSPESASLRLDYIDSKQRALDEVMQATREEGLRAVGILPTFMIGPYDALPSSGKLMLAFIQGRLRYATNGGRNFVHVHDVCDAIINGIESDISGRSFVAGNINLTYWDFLSRVSEVLHVPGPSGHVPNSLVKLTGAAGSLIGKITGRKPMLSYDMACISCEHQYIQNISAVSGLNMPQTDINVAIQDCYNWFRKEGYC